MRRILLPLFGENLRCFSLITCCSLLTERVDSETFILKRKNLGGLGLASYRPNLFVAKLLDRIVLDQIRLPLETQQLYDPFQSASPKLHGTETAHGRVQSEIYCTMGKRNCAPLVL